MKLYKYYPITSLSFIIDKQTFRFTQPNQFNDLYDSLPNIKCEALRLKKYEGININQNIKTLFKDEILNKHNANELQFQENIQNKISKEVGVLCLTSTSENTLMWSHYASNHSGFVIEIDTNNQWFQNNFIVKKVVYKNERTKVTFKDILNKQYDFIYEKSKDWIYENEYRIVMPLFGCKDNNNIYTMEFPTNLITNIICGYRMEDKYIEKIKEYLNDDVICQVNPDSTNYKMRERELI